jgi:hypothetical protein
MKIKIRLDGVFKPPADMKIKIRLDGVFKPPIIIITIIATLSYKSLNKLSVFYNRGI